MLQTENKISPVVAVLSSRSRHRYSMSSIEWAFYRLKWLVCFRFGWRLGECKEYPACVELAWFNFWSDGGTVVTDVATVGVGWFTNWWYDVDTLVERFDG